jgi:sterol carrier protein 2
MKKHNLQDRAVEILGMSMATDFPDTFDSMAGLCGYGLSKAASQNVYEQSGMGPEDLDVVELHDCFASNELLSYEALGLCPVGKAGEFVDSEANTYGGKIVVNPSGGLISKGHPLGATGLAQAAEMVWQVRGKADKRQVEGAKVAMSHNIGLGGACVVTMYRKAT